MLFIFILVLCLSSIVSSQKKCRALVLQGGGDKGSYQVGALSEMLRLIPDEIHYDVISGVSAGAINAGGLAQFPIGQEAEGINYLLDLWRTINSSNVYQEWPDGILESILYDPSLFDTTPLANFLDEKLKKPIVRKLIIGAVDSNLGRYVRYNESMSREDLLVAIKASAALPALFPYVNINGEQFIDGGVLLGLDVDGAVERCREMVEHDSDIIVDILLCSGDSIRKSSQKGDKTLEMLGRFIQIHFYSTALDHLLHAFEDNPDIFFRYVIMPTKTLASDPLPLQFNSEQIEEMIQTGVQDARDKILNGTFGMSDIEGKWRDAYSKPSKRGSKNIKKDGFLSLY